MTDPTRAPGRPIFPHDAPGRARHEPPRPAAHPHRPPRGGVEPQVDAALMWFRRDLRVHDNAALYHALKSARKVYAAFVFDSDILDPLLAQGAAHDRRVEFIHKSVLALDEELRAAAARQGVEGVRLIVMHGHGAGAIAQLASALHVQAVFANHDDDPAALARDAKARGLLADIGISLHTSKDHLVFERSEVLAQGGTPYSVFTPYKKAWLEKVDEFYLSAYPVEKYIGALAPVPADLRHGNGHGMDERIPALASLGFEPTNLSALPIVPGSAGARAAWDDFCERMDDYERTRNFPAVKGPSYLSVHLRFGTISIREVAREAWTRVQEAPLQRAAGAATWLSELIWREFYHQVLAFHPHVVGHAFKPEYDKLRFEHGKHADALFAAWCEGRTGYPLVDAAMAQINATGYMHNRLRMVTASFLVKDLGIDWRLGEAYFAKALIDYELASNNGGWQWAASTGTDAQPWFRIFNPVTQSEKFDAEGRFIRRYLPALARLPDTLIHAPWRATPLELQAAGVALGKDYPHPVVDHAEARERTLERYGVMRSRAAT